MVKTAAAQASTSVGFWKSRESILQFSGRIQRHSGENGDHDDFIGADTPVKQYRLLVGRATDVI